MRPKSNYLADAILTVVGGVLFALVIWAFVLYLDRPIVYFHDLTGECLRVEDPAAKNEGRPAYTCDRLPSRYVAAKAM